MCARVEPMDAEQRGGFLAIRAAQARDVRAASSRARRARRCARRRPRLGPAPYLRDDQLRDAVAALGEIVRDERDDVE